MGFKVRKDFNPEKTQKHIAELRVAINHLTAVDEIGGLPGGKKLLNEGYELCHKLDALVEKALLKRRSGKENTGEE